MVEVRTEKTKKLQEDLRALIEKVKDDVKDRFDNIKFDVPKKVPDEDLGIYGPRTKKAVRQLQRALGMEVTGIADDETLAGLEAKLAGTLDKTKLKDVESVLVKSPVTPAGKVFTQYMEGFGATKYDCSSGYCTIGYGTSWEKGMPNTITLAQADTLMDKTMAEKYALAKEKFGKDKFDNNNIDKLKPNERDAVMDLVYNIKPNSLGQKLITSVKKLADCQDEAKRPALVDEVAACMMKYDKQNHGLKKRRKAEVMLLKGEFDELEKFMKEWHGDSIGMVAPKKTRKELGDKKVEEIREEIKNIKIPNFKENYSNQQDKAPPEPQLPTQVSNTRSTSTGPAAAPS